MSVSQTGCSKMNAGPRFIFCGRHYFKCHQCRMSILQLLNSSSNFWKVSLVLTPTVFDMEPCRGRGSFVRRSRETQRELLDSSCSASTCPAVCWVSTTVSSAPFQRRHGRLPFLSPQKAATSLLRSTSCWYTCKLSFRTCDVTEEAKHTFKWNLWWKDLLRSLKLVFAMAVFELREVLFGIRTSFLF